MQVDPIKPMLKTPVTKRLTLKYDEPLSTFAFKINLRRYIQVLALTDVSEKSTAEPVGDNAAAAPAAVSMASAASSEVDASMTIAGARTSDADVGRGLHSFPFRLNVSGFCGTRGASSGCLGGVLGWSGDNRDY